MKQTGAVGQRGKKNDGRNWQVDDHNWIHYLHERNIHTIVRIYIGVRKEK